MAMELKMVNPRFEAHPSDGSAANWYVLRFDGWDGFGNTDGNGNTFYYEIECEDIVWNCAHAYAYGYSWFFSVVYDDDTDENADFSNTEIEVVIREMMEMINKCIKALEARYSIEVPAKFKFVQKIARR